MKKDKFRNRLMIPILDQNSKYIGFTGRVFPFDDNANRPKYLNSADSDVFKKGDILFGYDKAVKKTRELKWIIFVEGNMDVIAGHKYGIENIIASQGTSVTDKQIQLLKRLSTKQILVAFDNDNAGIISSRKLFIQLVNANFSVLKLIIPNEFKDIDEYLPTLAKTENLTQHSIDSFVYKDYIEYELDLIRPFLQSNKAELVREKVNNYLDLLSKIPPLIAEQYIKILSVNSSFSVPTLTGIYQNFYAANQKNSARNTEDIDQVDIAENEQNSSVLDNHYTSQIGTFQQIISIYYKQKIDDIKKEKLFFIYNIFNFLHPDYFKQDDLFAYINDNVEMLEFIYTEKCSTVDNFQTNNWFNSLIFYIDSNIHSFLFDEKLKMHYQALKMGLIR